MVENKTREIRNLSENNAEVENLSHQIRGLNDQIRRAKGENEGLYGQVQESQDKLRLSTNEIRRLSG